MYLAATSEAMVSPSEIVDIVWHQHLIFTSSYDTFCGLLGKKINHTPSTGSTKEAALFEKARDHTRQAYEKTFGQMPAGYWKHSTIYGPLLLKQSGQNIQMLPAIGIVAFLTSAIGAYFLLKDIYAQIGNPAFPLGYAVVFCLVASALRYYSKWRIRSHVQSLPADTFIAELDPPELVYMCSESVENAIHDVVNTMVLQGKLEILRGSRITTVNENAAENEQGRAIISVLDGYPKGMHYRRLVRAVRFRPAFRNVAGFVQGLKTHFTGSELYVRLLTVNFIGFMLVMSAGTARLMTGIMREKPVGFLVALLMGSGVYAFHALRQCQHLLTKDAIPSVTRNKRQNAPKAGEWGYFLYNKAALAAGMALLVSQAMIADEVRPATGSADSGSCGSSCGSSCGGCGGCGD